MSDATRIQQLPNGKGREITPLVIEDLLRKEPAPPVICQTSAEHPFVVPTTIHGAYEMLLGVAFYVTWQRAHHAGEDPLPMKVVERLKRKLEERSEMGKKKYGETLRAFNGRDAWLDLDQELLDAVKYFKQVIEEAENDGQR